MCGCSSCPSAFVPAGHAVADMPSDKAAKIHSSCDKEAAAKREKSQFSSPCPLPASRVCSTWGSALTHVCRFTVPFHRVKYVLNILLSALSSSACFRILLYGCLLGVSVVLSQLLTFLFHVGMRVFAVSAAFSLLKSTLLTVFCAAASAFTSCPATAVAFFLLCFFLPLPVRFRRSFQPAVIGTCTLTPRQPSSACASCSRANVLPEGVFLEDEVGISSPSEAGCVESHKESADLLSAQPCKNSIAFNFSCLTVWPPSVGYMRCSCGVNESDSHDTPSQGSSIYCCSSCKADTLAGCTGKTHKDISCRISSRVPQPLCVQEDCAFPRSSSSKSSSDRTLLQARRYFPEEARFQKKECPDGKCCCCEAPSQIATREKHKPSAAPYFTPVHPKTEEASSSLESREHASPSHCLVETIRDGDGNDSSWEAVTQQEESSTRNRVISNGHVCCGVSTPSPRLLRQGCFSTKVEEADEKKCNSVSYRSSSTSHLLRFGDDYNHCKHVGMVTAAAVGSPRGDEKAPLSLGMQQLPADCQKQQKLYLHMKDMMLLQQQQQQNAQDVTQPKHVKEEEGKQQQQHQQHQQHQQQQHQQQRLLHTDQHQEQEKHRQQLLRECPSLREGFKPACWALQQRFVQAVLVGAQDVIRLLPLFEYDFSLHVAAADRTMLLLRYLRYRTSTLSSDSSGRTEKQQQHQQQHQRQQSASISPHVQQSEQQKGGYQRSLQLLQQQQQQGRMKYQINNEKPPDTTCCGCRGIVFVVGGIGARGKDAHLQAVCSAAAEHGFCCYFLSCLRGIEVPICTRPTDLTTSDDLEAALQVVVQDHCLHSLEASAQHTSGVLSDAQKYAATATVAASAAVVAAESASPSSGAAVCYSGTQQPKLYCAYTAFDTGNTALLMADGNSSTSSSASNTSTATSATITNGSTTTNTSSITNSSSITTSSSTTTNTAVPTTTTIIPPRQLSPSCGGTVLPASVAPATKNATPFAGNDNTVGVADDCEKSSTTTNTTPNINTTTTTRNTTTTNTTTTTNSTHRTTTTIPTTTISTTTTGTDRRYYAVDNNAVGVGCGGGNSKACTRDSSRSAARDGTDDMRSSGKTCICCCGGSEEETAYGVEKQTVELKGGRRGRGRAGGAGGGRGGGEGCTVNISKDAVVKGKLPLPQNLTACMRPQCRKDVYFVAFSMGACMVTNFLGRLGDLKSLLEQHQQRYKKNKKSKSCHRCQNMCSKKEMFDEQKQHARKKADDNILREQEHVKGARGGGGDGHDGGGGDCRGSDGYGGGGDGDGDGGGGESKHICEQRSATSSQLSLECGVGGKHSVENASHAAAISNKKRQNTHDEEETEEGEGLCHIGDQLSHVGDQVPQIEEQVSHTGEQVFHLGHKKTHNNSSREIVVAAQEHNSTSATSSTTTTATTTATTTTATSGSSTTTNTEGYKRKERYHCVDGDDDETVCRSHRDHHHHHKYMVDTCGVCEQQEEGEEVGACDSGERHHNRCCRRFQKLQGAAAGGCGGGGRGEVVAVVRGDRQQRNIGGRCDDDDTEAAAGNAEAAAENDTGAAAVAGLVWGEGSCRPTPLALCGKYNKAATAAAVPGEMTGITKKKESNNECLADLKGDSSKKKKQRQPHTQEKKCHCVNATSRQSSDTTPPRREEAAEYHTHFFFPSKKQAFLLSLLPRVKGAVTVSNALCLESSLGFLDGSASLTAWLCRHSIAALYKIRQWKEPCALHKSRGIDEGLIHLSQMASASSLRALDFLTHLSLCGQACSAAYYSRVRCVEALLRVPVPLLSLHALDDPVLDASLLCRVAAAVPKRNPNVTFAVTEKGGHALFAEDWLLLSRSPYSCYHARVATEFIEALANHNKHDEEEEEEEEEEQEKEEEEKEEEGFSQHSARK